MIVVTRIVNGNLKGNITSVKCLKMSLIFKCNINSQDSNLTSVSEFEDNCSEIVDFTMSPGNVQQLFFIKPHNILTI